MNEENRKKVMRYLENYAEITPLTFDGYESKVDEFNIEKHSVVDMVKRALFLTKAYSSYCDGDYDCASGKMRSALDIWRHIKYYYPTIEIFDVMKALYELNHNKDIYGHFCTDVGRRVFKLEYSSGGDHVQINMYPYANRYFDEFELQWADWENI